MSIIQQEKLLEKIQRDKTTIALELTEVRMIDQRLEQGWGIGFVEEVQSLPELLKPVTDREAVERFTRAKAKVEANHENTAALDAATAVLYDTIADRALLGPITTQRRHFILDGICAAIGLVRRLGIGGTIIDVGCHAGFVGSILSEVLNRPVVGIDPSAVAIVLGRSYLKNNQELELVHAGIPWETSARFGVVVAIDSMPTSESEVGPFLMGISDILDYGGIALICSQYWVDASTDVTRRQLSAANLGFGYADIVGGYGSVPREFGAEGVVVLIKGGKRILPRMLRTAMESEWKQFATYANGFVHNREKTQAFARANHYCNSRSCRPSAL